MSTPLNWGNLKKNKCPRCNLDMVKYPCDYTPYNQMLKHKCGFIISAQKFNQIVADMVAGTLGTRLSPSEDDLD